MDEWRKTTVNHYAYCPCNFLEEALKAMFKCLGFETEPREDSSSLKHKDEMLSGTSTQDSSSTSEQVADTTPSTSYPDPPSATTDSEADLHSNTETIELAASIMAVHVPPRPTISGSRIGPQIN